MTEAETTGEMPEAAAEAAAESADTENSTDILIAYFSWSGNTEALAEMIQAETAATCSELRRWNLTQMIMIRF